MGRPGRLGASTVVQENILQLEETLLCLLLQRHYNHYCRCYYYKAIYAFLRPLRPRLNIASRLLRGPTAAIGLLCMKPGRRQGEDDVRDESSATGAPRNGQVVECFMRTRSHNATDTPNFEPIV